jgi:NAD(P)-dependent dehydrogenase (short-subunit alcohol dehydrogenase family)
LHFVRAGASLTIVARKQETLDASRDTILRERPSAQVLTFPADVRDVKKVAEAVAATVAHFGRLDILVANAATIRPSFQRACSSFLRTLVECLVRQERNFVQCCLAIRDIATWFDLVPQRYSIILMSLIIMTLVREYCGWQAVGRQ